MDAEIKTKVSEKIKLPEKAKRKTVMTKGIVFPSKRTNKRTTNPRNILVLAKHEEFPDFFIVKLKTEYFQWNGVEHTWHRLFCLFLFNKPQRSRYKEGKKAQKIEEQEKQEHSIIGQK